MDDEGRASGSSDFGKLLRHYRVAAGLSQEALAERARMSKDGISALERGYRRSPQRETLSLLATALSLTQEQRQGFEATARAGGPRRLGRSSVTVGPWPVSAPSILPLALTNFVGRETELADISALILEHRLVTLTGSGGVGKTQTALQVAAANAQTDGASFIGLATVSDPTLIARAVASALGVQPVANRAPLETLVGFLKNRTSLLVLDNCEHVIAGAASLVESLLASCPRVRILATSREPLRVAGERSYRLPSLSLPPVETDVGISARVAASYAAVALFTDRARAVDYRFKLTDVNAPLVAELCRRLDGIPLAIELAAARTNVLSIKALSEKLNERFRLLAIPERAVLPRHQTMRATIDWSYNLLTVPEQRAFERLSVFAGGCTLTGAAAVGLDEGVDGVDALDLLSSLVDKSLVVADLDRGEPRYRLLESFREYAREKLAKRSESERIARRHAQAYLELAERLDLASDSEPDEVWRTTARDELDNWRAALEWTLTARNDGNLGQRIAGALSVVWQNFAPVEGRRWLNAAFETVDAQTPTAVLAALRYAEANVAMVLSENKLQLAGSDSALEHYRNLQDPLGAARAQSRCGHALIYLSRIPEAMALLHEALAAARRLNNPRLTAFTLRCLGLASAQAGDFSAARAYATETLPIYELLHAKLGAAAALDELGEYEFFAGNPELSVRHATAMLATMREVNAGPRQVATALNGLSGYLLALERYDEAWEHACEALELSREHELDVLSAHALQHLAAAIAGRTPEDATRILGFVDARLAALGSERMLTQQREYDVVVARLREGLGNDAVTGFLNEGAAMTEEQTVKCAVAAPYGST